MRKLVFFLILFVLSDGVLADSLTKAVYVLDNKQEITIQCPADQIIRNAYCSGETRSLRNSLINDDVNGVVFTHASILNESAFQVAKCNAVLVKPPEVVRLLITVNCENKEKI